MSEASPQHQVAAVLERLAADLGQECWRRAAAELRRPTDQACRRGRRSIDDGDAFEEMRVLIADGLSVERAAGVVAKARGGQSIDSTRDRLARKYRRNSPT